MLKGPKHQSFDVSGCASCRGPNDGQTGEPQSISAMNKVLCTAFDTGPFPSFLHFSGPISWAQSTGPGAAGFGTKWSDPASTSGYTRPPHSVTQISAPCLQMSEDDAELAAAIAASLQDSQPSAEAPAPARQPFQSITSAATQNGHSSAVNGLHTNSQDGSAARPPAAASQGTSSSSAVLNSRSAGMSQILGCL